MLRKAKNAGLTFPAVCELAPALVVLRLGCGSGALALALGLLAGEAVGLLLLPAVLLGFLDREDLDVLRKVSAQRTREKGEHEVERQRRAGAFTSARGLRVAGRTV